MKNNNTYTVMMQDESVFMIENGDTLIKCIPATESIVIPSCIKTIADYAFAISICCEEYKNYDYGAEFGYELPEHIDKTMKCINSQNKIITTINISGSIKIGKYAFYQCCNLKTVNIMGNADIGDSAFEDCENLRDINIFGKAYIDDNAFLRCKSLKNINIQNIISIGRNAFCFCTSLTHIDIPAIQEIKERTFEDCKSLCDVNIADGVVIIDANAFQGCSSLTKINLPDSVKEIQKFAFYYTAIEEVKINDDVDVAKTAFENKVKINNRKLFTENYLKSYFGDEFFNKHFNS